MVSNTRLAIAGGLIVALVVTGVVVIGNPFVDDRMVKGSDGQWDVNCAADDARTDLETTIRNRDGVVHLSIKGTVTYSADRRLAIHPTQHQSGEVIVFVAPTDEPLQEHANLDCERVQSSIDVTVRIDDEYRSIQVVAGGTVVDEHGNVTDFTE
ncbi:hypothetical protein [Halorubellus sp. PRR65]|uniref:hypothetical protein n=1 Tax=Halorubellus sp. PRR65 TaxID=3098148 RepID=UPI002B26009B|nr:hypothetical protein [Halorubellus sp. PRR65]